MPRRGNVPKREVLPDPMYNSVLVTKLVNSIMLDGKKGVAQKIVYGAFDIVKEKTEKDPLEGLSAHGPAGERLADRRTEPDRRGAFGRRDLADRPDGPEKPRQVSVFSLALSEKELAALRLSAARGGAADPVLLRSDVRRGAGL